MRRRDLHAGCQLDTVGKPLEARICRAVTHLCAACINGKPKSSKYRRGSRRVTGVRIWTQGWVGVRHGVDKLMKAAQS